MTIIRPTTINARFSQPVGLGGEKLWLCPTLGGDRLDLSGNGNHGTYNGGIETVADKFKGNRAYSFNGIDGYIDCPSVLPIVSDLISNSISFWYRQETLGNDPDFMGTKGGGTNGWRMELQVFVPANDRNLSLKSLRVTNYSLNTAPDDTNWHHVTLNVDSSRNGQWFFDGDALGSSFTVLQAGQNVSEFSIGRIPGVSVTNAVYLDDIRIYDRILSAGEVKHLASKRGVLGSPRQPYDPLKRTVVRVPSAIPAATVVGSIKKPTTIIKPSYQAGYARNASESENPKLWDGLVGAWMPSLGVTGETLRDVSGNGNHGTLTNMDAATDWVGTSKGLALDFDGSSDTIQTNRSTNSFYGQSNSVTFSCVFRADLIHQGGLIATDGSNRFYIETFNRSGQMVAHWGFGAAQNYPQTQALISSNRWYNYTATYDGSVAKGYLDGVETDSQVIGSQTFSGNVFLASFGSRLYFNGKINSWHIYNRALSPTEIKQLYVDSLAPFRRKQRASVVVPADTPTPSATYHPLRSLAHPLEQ